MLPEKLADFIAVLFHEDDNTMHLFDSDKGLSIHRNNYQATLLRTLENHYPMTLKLLGNPFFANLANDYIAHYPSLSPELNDYGAYFFDFIATHPSILPIHYVADIAKLEWLCHQLPRLDTASPPDLSSLDLIARLYNETLQVECNAAVQLMSSNYPLLTLIDYCQTPQEEDLTLTEKPCYLLIIKTKNGCSFISLSESEYGFMHALMHDIPLNLALSNTLKHDNTFQLEHTLIKLIALNVIRLSIN